MPWAGFVKPNYIMDKIKDCCEPSNICEGNARPEYPNTELYVGTKIVKGVPMTEADFYTNIKKQDISDRETYGDGYMVTYEDGYVSWSPKEVFERCYRLLSNKEINMAKNVIL